VKVGLEAMERTKVMNIALIQESFEAIKPHASMVLEHFFQELHSSHPQAKNNFFAGIQTPEQTRSLVNHLTHIVEFIEDTSHLMDYLRKLGKKNAAMHLEAHHFLWIKDSLKATLSYFLEEHWTPELALNWGNLLNFCAQEVLAGMREENSQVLELPVNPGKQPTIPELIQKVAQGMLTQALNEEMKSPLFQQQLQERVQELLRKAVKTEALQLLTEAKSSQRSA
jgi:hemoglobin-like flavoprotein